MNHETLFRHVGRPLLPLALRQTTAGPTWTDLDSGITSQRGTQLDHPEQDHPEQERDRGPGPPRHLHRDVKTGPRRPTLDIFPKNI